MPGERSIRRIAVLGNHLPRRRGIAPLTTDLSEAIAAGSLYRLGGGWTRMGAAHRCRTELEKS